MQDLNNSQEIEGDELDILDSSESETFETGTGLFNLECKTTTKADNSILTAQNVTLKL